MLYLLLLQLFFKFIKFHFLRLFLFYLLSFIPKLEYPILKLRLNLIFNRFTIKFIDKVLFQNNANKIHFIIDQFVYFHIIGLEFIIHRVILFIIIIYDIKYNNMILTHMFKIMPYIFIYDLWVKFYLFLLKLNLDYDKIISRVLYQEITSVNNDKECLYLNGEPFEKQLISEILLKYIPQGFIDKQFILVDPIKHNFTKLLTYWTSIITSVFKKMAIIETIDILFFIFLLIFFCLF